MPERERVQKAIEAPVAEAAKLLEESRGADVETRLAMLIDGWGRGLAAGLEELAIAVADLRRATQINDTPPPEPSRKPAPAVESEEETRPEHEPRTEDELQAEAARSREATAKLREEGARQ